MFKFLLKEILLYIYNIMTFYQELCKGLNQDKLRIKTKLDDEPTKKQLNIISRKFKVNFDINNEKNETKYPITLTFKYGKDYNLKYVETGNKSFNRFYKTKKFGCYKKNDDNTFDVYNGITYGKTVKNLAKFNNFSLMKFKKDDNLIEEYEAHIKGFDTIKKLINFDYTNANHNTINLSKRIWYKLVGKNVNFSKTSHKEETYIYEAKRCGFRYSAEKGIYEGDYIKLDVNSFYSSILMNKKYTLPIGEPQFIKYTQEEFNNLKFYKYGLYKCMIEGDINPKLLYINKKNVYTHLELNIAKEQNYKINIITTEEDNFMYYPKRINNNRLFEDYVNLLFPHKNKCFLIKKLLNCLWGSLCELNKVKKCVNMEEIQTLKDDDLEFKPTMDNDGNIVSFSVVEQKKIFKYNSCKIAPFITAYGRYEYYNLIKNHHKKIIKTHTDGFILNMTENEAREVFDINVDIGKLKIEGKYKKLKIVNNNSVVAL